jgi:hypothetical protein
VLVAHGTLLDREKIPMKNRDSLLDASGLLLLATASLVALEYPLGQWGCDSIGLSGGGSGLLLGLVLSPVAAGFATRAAWPSWRWFSLPLGFFVLAVAIGLEWLGAADGGCQLS